MGDESRREDAGANVCVVESTDANGNVVSRNAFPTAAEGEAHAAEMRAKGLKVSHSPLPPTALPSGGRG